MKDVEGLASNLSAVRNTIVGYTHFGYRGYESRYVVRNVFNRRSRLEWWSTRNSHRTAARLARLLDRHGLKSLTLSGLLERATALHDG